MLKAVRNVKPVRTNDQCTTLSSTRYVGCDSLAHPQYSILPDLAVSGVARRRESIFLAVEFHRHIKSGSVPSRQAKFMDGLDDDMQHFNRAGQSSGRPAAAKLIENYEKHIAYQLMRANIVTVHALHTLQRQFQRNGSTTHNMSVAIHELFE